MITVIGELRSDQLGNLKMVKCSEDQSVQRMIWAAALTVVTLITTVELACATPFPALAATAALFFPRKDAFMLIGANFLLNQAVGFGLMHWPMTAWIGGLHLATACAACLIAASLAHRVLHNHATGSAIGTFLASFFAFEASLFLTLSGSHGMADLQVYLYIFYINGLSFAALLAMQGLATAVGLVNGRTVSITPIAAAA
jgi:hypothetical protein